MNENDSHSLDLDPQQGAGLTINRLSISLGPTTIVRDVSLTVQPGRVHCLVGDSGTGKSLTSLAAIGLLPRQMEADGSVHIGGNGENLLRVDDTAWANLRGNCIGYMGQNALGCLHPAYTIEFQLIEAIRRHQAISRDEARKLALKRLAEVDLDEPAWVAQARPAQLSGGMCQRVALAIALANAPQVLIADEPTTALDDATQQRILELLMSRATNEGVGVLLITHDHDVVSQVADDVTSIADGVSSPGRVTPPAVTKRRAPAETPTSTGTPALAIRAVSKSYTSRRRWKELRTPVLSEVSITAESGRTVGLVGRSGAGKTTLARIVAGILPPTAGEVRIDGQPITGPGRAGRIERAGLTQYVFQDPFGSLNPRRNALSQVAEPLTVMGWDQSDALDAANAMLRSVGLSVTEGERRPAELSGGQCQRVGLARALIRRPRVVVLDEPVSALDWSIRREILSILRDMQAELGATYLLISHARPLIDEECDEVYEIADGLVRLA